MSLDKFGFSKNPKEPKKTSKKTDKTKELEDEVEENIEGANDLDHDSEDPLSDAPTDKDSSVVSSRKKNLKCTDAKCGYKRTLNKRDLEPDDYICKKCGKPMKLTK